jgi:RnfABCDGE-type electron transport complex B subunit
MIYVTIGLAASTMLVMALVFSYILGWANTAFHVEVDPRINAIMDALPGANCGGCGFIGCGEYAEAVVDAGAEVNKCPVGGESCASEVARIMGVELGAALPFRPVIHCGAHYEERLGRTEYHGDHRCASANIVADVQGCTYGCLGFGDCASVCDYDALHVIDGLATVDYEKCIGCGACAKVCPRNIITITPFKAERILAVTCSNKDKGKDITKVCTVGCIGCGACARTSDLFTIENNLSTINYNAYEPVCSLDVLQACEKCPRHRIVFVGKKDTDDTVTFSGEVVEPDFKTTVDDTEWRG